MTGGLNKRHPFTKVVQRCLSGLGVLVVVSDVMAGSSGSRFPKQPSIKIFYLIIDKMKVVCQ
jgi:hypothetical protein